jgi:hypothetical protein
MSNYRYEIKFVLNEESLSYFLGWMHLNTNCRKKYPNRTVNSIYFDDSSFSSVRDNLAGVPDRMKTRLRWYQNKNNLLLSDPVLEQKLKSGRLGKKESITLSSLGDDLLNIPIIKLRNMIENQLPIDHKAYLEHIIPTLYVSYNRQYYENSDGLRITVDEDIRFKSNFSYSISINQLTHISYRSKIIELKFDPSLKNKVNNLLKSLSLTPIRHSKYLTGLAMHGQAQYI